MYETQSESSESESESSVPNLERFNLGDNVGYRSKYKRLSLPCPCAGCLFWGFSKIYDNYSIDTQNLLLSRGSSIKNTLTQKYHSYSQIGLIQREGKEWMTNYKWKERLLVISLDLCTFVLERSLERLYLLECNLFAGQTCR